MSGYAPQEAVTTASSSGSRGTEQVTVNICAVLDDRAAEPRETTWIGQTSTGWSATGRWAEPVPPKREM